MKSLYKISDVARLFDLPVATLHYWESVGLFSAGRDSSNRYRNFGINDILNIWEIVLYRELGISIHDITEIMNNTGKEALEALYSANILKTEGKIEQLTQIKNRLEEQLDTLHIVQTMEQRGVTYEQPDFEMCTVDNYEIETMMHSLSHPYDCGVISDKSGSGLIRTHCFTTLGEGRKPIWTIRGGAGEYAEFLMKVRLDDMDDNNISAQRKLMEERGYKTGVVVARFLTVISENDSRYEFYRAWMELA